MHTWAGVRTLGHGARGHTDCRGHAELRSWCCEEGKLAISRGVLTTKKAEDPHTGTGRVTNRPAVLSSKRTQMDPSGSPIWGPGSRHS